MNQKFNENILKALETSQDAMKVCKKAMEDANDETCRAMYSAIIRDCEKHVKMLKGEIDLHKVQKKWD
jgi:DNA-binding ferritin-like protein